MSTDGTDDTQCSQTATDSRSRRDFLKKTGVVSLLGGTGSLAGFTGTGVAIQRSTLNLTSFPLNYDGVIATYIEREGILEKKMDAAGYDYTLQFVFEDIPLFVSGKSDHVNMGTLETARLAAERDIPLAQCGRIDSTFYGPQVKAGSDLTVGNSGGIEQSLKKLANDNGRLAILGWGIGYIPAEQVYMRTQYDLEFSEQGGDFSNVVTADPAAIPTMIVEGDVAAGMIAPTSSPAQQWYNDEIEPLYWDTDALMAAGLGNPLLSGPVFKQSTVEQKRDGIQAYMDALEEGCKWFYDEGIDKVPKDEELRGKLNAPNEEVARFQCNWLAAWHTGKDVKYALDNVTGYRQPKLDDTWIEQDRKYVNNANEFGLVADDWSEDKWGDLVTHEKF
ncbi:MAG: twin-arginine translocation signal domain-containing protein [Salinigranum sp.]